jgi:hypothetical protein
VELGRLFVSSLSHQRHFDSAAGNSILFGQAMRKYRRDSAVKEIENSIVDVLKSNSQFVYTIAEKISLRPPQLVPQFRKPLNSDSALVLRFGRQSVEPFQNRDCAVRFAVKDDLTLGHVGFMLADFAKLRKSREQRFSPPFWSFVFCSPELTTFHVKHIDLKD